jgi:DNA-binding NarL/FixJ family response regulator
MPPITVLLVDDHVVLRQALRLMIEADPRFQVVGEASEGSMALREIARLRPRVAMVDIKMPGIGGLDIIPRISTVGHGTATLVFSMYDNPAYVRAAMRAGAKGYLLKSVDRKEMLQALEAVGSGAGFVQRQVASPLVRQTVLDMRSDPGRLSVREIQVLELIATGSSNRDIAEALSVSEETVKTHLKRLYEKLGASDRTHAVSIALRQRLID